MVPSRHPHAWCVLALVPSLALAGAVDTKTLDRLHDPVVIPTAELASAPDRATSAWRLYAGRTDGVQPIPFQFDARDHKGELVLSEDGSESEFSFDDDDELVFMAKDTGNRLADAALPPAHDVAFEIEVADPSGAQRGWAYLLHFPGTPPPRSPVRYATFDPAGQEVRAYAYRARYSHERSNFLSGVHVAGGAGGTEMPLFGTIWMRISPTFSFLLKTWRATFTERSFSVEPDGLKNGPVRAVRRVRQYLELGALFPDIPNGRVSTYYYPTYFTTPSTFSIPWLVLKALRDFHFESTAELGVPAAGMRYWDAANPDGVPFTGRQQPIATDSDHDWWVVSGSAGTCLYALAIPDEWHAWGIRRGIVFRQDEEATGAGYSLLRMVNLRRAGTYRLSMALMVLPRAYQPGDEAQALAALRDPLQVEVREVGRFSAAAAGRASDRPPVHLAGGSH